MPKLGTVLLKGASGRAYELEVFPRADAFKPLGAVFFLAKRIPVTERSVDYTWIYVGETHDLSQRPFDESHKACVDRHEANTVCLYMEEDPAQRSSVATDLQRALTPPCNDPLPAIQDPG